MSTFDTIKEKHIAARKGRDAIASALLGTIVSDIAIIGKNEGRNVQDTDSIKVLRKHLKGIEEFIASVKDEPKLVSKLSTERSIILDLLPRQLDYDEIVTVIRHNHLATVKEAMAYFKHHYEGRYDGKEVSGYFR